MTLREGSTLQPNAFLTSLFRGRITRRSFFDFYALYAVVLVGLAIAMYFASRGLKYPLLTALLFWGVALLVPFVAASSRRFHDTGRSGWWFLPQFGVLALAYVAAQSLTPTPYEERVRDMIDGSGCNYLWRPGDPLELNERQKSPECVEWRKTRNERMKSRSEARAHRRQMIALASWGPFAFAHIATLYALARPSQPGPNKYGPNPHEVTP